MRGMDWYTSAAGFSVLRIHYTADTEKDPATESGARWLKEELKGYPGGMSSSSWRQEFEIDWEAAGGDLVFPQFEPFKNKIVVPPFEPPESWLYFGSFDYGHRSPSSFHVHCIDHDRSVWTVWEFYMAGIGYRKIARAIKACPYYRRLVHAPIADPSIWAKTQQSTIGGDESEVKSVAQLFSEIEEGDFDDDFAGPVLFVPGQRGGDVTAAERINGDLWHELGENEPRWRIFATCPFLAWELGKLRYADWPATTQEFRNLRESIVDRDNHSWDDAKMFFNQFYFGPQRVQVDPLDRLKAVDLRSYREWKRVREMRGEQSDKALGVE